MRPEKFTIKAQEAVVRQAVEGVGEQVQPLGHSEPGLDEGGLVAWREEAARVKRDLARRGTGEVREQLADGAVAERRAGQVPVERVVEVQQALVAQPHHQDGGDRLADGAEPVLDVGVRLGHLAPAGGPRQPAVPDDPGQSVVLYSGDEVVAGGSAEVPSPPTRH